MTPSIAEGFGLPALHEVSGEAAHCVDPLNVEDMAAAHFRLAPVRSLRGGVVQRLLRLLAVPPAGLNRLGPRALRVS